MQARTPEELQFRRVVLGIGTPAGSFGAVVFVVVIARLQFDLVSLTALGTSTALGVVDLAAAWASGRRLASYLDPPVGRTEDRDGDEG